MLLASAKAGGRLAWGLPDVLLLEQPEPVPLPALSVGEAEAEEVLAPVPGLLPVGQAERNHSVQGRFHIPRRPSNPFRIPH